MLQWNHFCNIFPFIDKTNHTNHSSKYKPFQNNVLHYCLQFWGIICTMVVENNTNNNVEEGLSEQKFHIWENLGLIEDISHRKITTFLNLWSDQQLKTKNSKHRQTIIHKLCMKRTDATCSFWPQNDTECRDSEGIHNVTRPWSLSEEHPVHPVFTVTVANTGNICSSSYLTYL